MTFSAIVAVKHLAAAKARLADTLSPKARETFVRLMLEDSLAALLNTPSIGEVVVVTKDAELSYLKAWPKVKLVKETSGNGLNSALIEGVNHADKDTSAYFFIHGDVPALDGKNLEKALTQNTGKALLFPDRHGTGSNGLLLPAKVFKEELLAFGANSFAKHQANLSMAAIDFLLVNLPTLALDIDTEADVNQLLQLPLQNNKSQQFLLSDACYRLPSHSECYALGEQPLESLMQQARPLGEQGFGLTMTYSKKVFLPLTQLCRDVCHYCTFAKTPKFINEAYMPLEKVLKTVADAKLLGCKEALLTLGERPELRYSAARSALKELGFASTLEYVGFIAKEIFEHSGILPHINAGCMSEAEMAALKPVSASMGLMLESASKRLCEKGMAHFGSPDKEPGRRLDTLRTAGKLKVPFTTGILIGIGETRAERIESLLAIRDIHKQYGHIQEIIIQNFKAKAGTQMANAPEPSFEELLWTIAVARIIFGPDMSIQAPPNLSPGVFEQLVAAGINDWGGVSPLTPDYVNPEAPWPELEKLGKASLSVGKLLHERLTIYPEYIQKRAQFLDKALHRQVLRHIDGQGLVKTDNWRAGISADIPEDFHQQQREVQKAKLSISPPIKAVLAKAKDNALLTEADIITLFSARGPDFQAVMQLADDKREQQVGNGVSLTVNRNINYTNICYFKCQFCAFSKGKLSEDLRGKPYDLSKAEIQRRVKEAYARGATELCMQGGIHPAYTGDTYIELCQMVKEAEPSAHIHAFSPLEIWHGAASSHLTLAEFLTKLKAAGLNTLPGTAAEVLDDRVRDVLCADKINTAQWREVMRQAHKQGLGSTATIMFGHVDDYLSWARHLIVVRDLQIETGSFTEFVPLPFVASESPIYLKGKARSGPSLRECLLMHAVARLALGPWLKNIQASWVKLGEQGVKAALCGGANDLGGTLMNESITRAAGASHGEENDLQTLQQWVHSLGRTPWFRNTLYQPLPKEQVERALAAKPLQNIKLDNQQRLKDEVRLIKPSQSLDPRRSEIL